MYRSAHKGTHSLEDALVKVRERSEISREFFPNISSVDFRTFIVKNHVERLYESVKLNI